MFQTFNWYAFKFYTINIYVVYVISQYIHLLNYYTTCAASHNGTIYSGRWFVCNLCDIFLWHIIFRVTVHK